MCVIVSVAKATSVDKPVVAVAFVCLYKQLSEGDTHQNHLLSNSWPFQAPTRYRPQGILRRRMDLVLTKVLVITLFHNLRIQLATVLGIETSQRCLLDRYLLGILILGEIFGGRPPYRYQ